MESPTIYSQHHFMFPFRWDILPKGFEPEEVKENISFDKRTDLDKGIPDTFGNWERCKYKLTGENEFIDHEAYNEFTYFHKYVSKALFDFDHPLKTSLSVVKYFEYKINKDLPNQYIIEYLENNSSNQIELELEGITLHFFNTGVGVLSFNLINKLESQKEKEVILKINEYGRRIYPQFLGKNGIQATKESILANKITLIINRQLMAVEDFSWYNLHENNPTVAEPHRLPSFITGLFPELFTFCVTATLADEKILISKVGDDRMFFQCWYGNNDLAGKIKDENDWLYCYIFGDKGIPGIANKSMQKGHLNTHTYGRWKDYGTLFGFARDSFVAISSDSKTLIENNAPDLRIHMRTMYYTLCALCLAQRASVLKFTAEVANLADLAKLEENKALVGSIKDLYKNYIEFINKLYFREITPQIQGIDIYNQFHEILNLKEEIKDLDDEINDLNSYVSLLQDDKRNEEAATFNKWAAIFLPATIMFGIFGSNFFEKESFWPLLEITWIGIGFIPSVIFYYIYKMKRR